MALSPAQLLPGALVVMCGIDGAGKSTQLERLARRLEQNGQRVLRTQQPTQWYRQDEAVQRLLGGGDADAAELRELALFAAADRLRHVRSVIAPALARGEVVLCDRYVYSSFAYFLARGLHGELEWLMDINRHCPAPDLVICLDLPVEVALRRLAARYGPGARSEETNAVRLEAVRDVLCRQPWGAELFYRVVQADRPESDVTADVVRLAGDALPPPGS